MVLRGGREPEFVACANLEQEVWAVQGAAAQVAVPRSYRNNDVSGVRLQHSQFNPSEFDMENCMRINLKPDYEAPPPEFRKQGHHMCGPPDISGFQQGKG